MSNSPWLDIAVTQPTDGQQVYVRRTSFSSTFLMYWNAALAKFTDIGADILVAGGGTAAANGSYFTLGATTGISYWILPGTHLSIGYLQAQYAWLITAAATINTATAYYQFGGLVPAGTGTVLANGTAPAPTIQIGKSIPWHLIQRWRPM